MEKNLKAKLKEIESQHDLLLLQKSLELDYYKECRLLYRRKHDQMNAFFEHGGVFLKNSESYKQLEALKREKDLISQVTIQGIQPPLIEQESMTNNYNMLVDHRRKLLILQEIKRKIF